jgi:hypothetical protein
MHLSKIYRSPTRACNSRERACCTIWSKGSVIIQWLWSLVSPVENSKSFCVVTRWGVQYRTYQCYGSVSGINIPDHNYESLAKILCQEYCANLLLRIWYLVPFWPLDRIENQKPQHGTVSPYFLVKCSFIGEFEVSWTYLLNAFISFSAYVAF